MGDGRLSTETAAGALDGTELMEVTQSGNTRVTTAQDIADLAPAAETGGVCVSAFGGALAKLTADNNYTAAADIDWDAVEYDTDSFWAAGSPTVFTVPAGVAKVRLGCTIQYTNNTSTWTNAIIYKNGAVFVGMASSETDGSDVTGAYKTTLTTAPVEVEEGDVFKIRVSNSDTNVDVMSAQSSFWIEVVEWDTDHSRVHNLAIQAPFGGALVKMTSDDNTIDATSGYALSFDAAEYDTDSFWSAGNSTRLTIPAGVNRVNITASARVEAHTSGERFTFSIKKNGVDYVQSPVEHSEAGSTGLVGGSLSTGAIEVSSGDYFEAFVYVTTDTSVTIRDDNTFLSIEVVEWDTSQYPTSNAVLAVQTKTDVETFDALPGVCYLVSTAATSGNESVRVDLAAPVTGGDRIGIKYVAAEGSGESVLINPSSAQDIDGSTADIELQVPGEYIELISAGDGVNWYIVSRVT